MRKALLTLAEACPQYAGQCLDLIRHIENGDKTVFAEKAKQLISNAVDCELYQNEEQKEILESAIADYERPQIQITIHGILTAHNLTQTALSKRFEIPLRTIQGWCNGTRKAPEYVLKMMEEILLKEQK